jgi:peptidoglycan hydrolase CwlO-like protein
MGKHTIVFYALFALILIILVTILFKTCGSNPNLYLNRALRDLDSAQHRLDTALVKIDDSKKVIDSMRLDLLNFQNQVTNVRSDVRQLNINSLNNEQLFRASMSDIRRRNQQLIERLKVHHDTLPEIKILSR